MAAALELARRPRYNASAITLIDCAELPNKNGASWDINRIVRADYAQPLYAALAEEALNLWRSTEWGQCGRYTESGLLMLGEKDASYIAEALALAKARSVEADVLEVAGGDEIIRVCQTGGQSGSWGYLNRKAGWANAEEVMAHAYEWLKGTYRVQIRHGKVDRLTTAVEEEQGHARVTGVILEGGEVIAADLTVIATGSYSPMILDMRGKAAASAELFAYFSLSDEEAERLQNMPAIINLSKGWFIVPPNNRVLKVARHGLGFSNIRSISHPMISDEALKGSIPCPSAIFEASVVREGLLACRQAVKEMIPWLADIEPTRTRIFWYTDTQNGNFIIDYHPQIAGLFVATGGSGHAFKFLPVLGRCIADRLEGTLNQAYADLWSWPALALASDEEVSKRAYIARGGVLREG